MTANKNMLNSRKLAKARLIAITLAEGASKVTEAMFYERTNFIIIPFKSMAIAALYEEKVKAIIATPAKYFRLDGTVDKRRQRKSTFNKSYLVKGNG